MTTTKTSRSVCPKCGTIEKSGKVSCCGRGGSWFRNCGSDGNAKLLHTWSEGMLACKTWAQLKTVRPRQANSAKKQNYFYGASYGTYMHMGNFKSIITDANTFSFTSASAPRLMPITDVTSTSMSDNTTTKYGTNGASSNATSTPAYASDNGSTTIFVHASMSNTFTAMLKTSPASNSILTMTTTTTNTTTTIATTATITHTVKKATVATDWMPQGMCYEGHVLCMRCINLIYVMSTVVKEHFNPFNRARTNTHTHTLTHTPPAGMQT